MNTTESAFPGAAEESVARPRTAAEAGTYQRLREHLAFLKLPDAAAALPSVLDTARAEHLSPTATIERLLAAEVAATAARRLASRLRFACLPPRRLRLRRPTRRR